ASIAKIRLFRQTAPQTLCGIVAAVCACSGEVVAGSPIRACATMNPERFPFPKGNEKTLLGGSTAMRVLTLPAVLVGVFAAPGSAEPRAAEMRSAVQATLTAQVQSVLDYIAETGGEEALARVRAARADTFDIRSFTKLDCTTSPDRPGHLCEFALRVG